MTSIGQKVGGASLVTKFVAPVLGVALFFSWLCGLFVYQSMVGETSHILDRRVSLVQAAISELSELYVSSNDLSQFLGNLQSISRSSSIVVVADEPPQVIASTDSSIVGTSLDNLTPEQFGPELREVIAEQRPVVRDGIYVLPLARSGEHAQAQVRRGALVVQFVGGETSYYRSRASMQVGILLLAMAVILTTLVYVIFTRFVTIPVQMMREYLQKFKIGVDDPALPLMYADEVGNFGNTVQNVLDQFVDEQRRNVALLNSVTVGIITVSETGFIVYANPTAYQLIGWEEETGLSGERIAAVFGEHGDVTELFRDFLAEWNNDGGIDPRLITLQREEGGALPVIGQIKPLDLADRRVVVLSLTEASVDSLPQTAAVAETLPESKEEREEQAGAKSEGEVAVAESEETTESDDLLIDEDHLLAAVQARLRQATERAPNHSLAGEGVSIEESETIAAISLSEESREEAQKLFGDIEDTEIEQAETLFEEETIEEPTPVYSLNEESVDELTEDEVSDVILALQEQLQRNVVFDVRQSFKAFAPDFAAIAANYRLEFRHDVRLTVPSFLSGDLQAVRELIELVLPLSAREYQGSRGIVLEVKLGEKTEQDTFLRFYFAQLIGRREEGDTEGENFSDSFDGLFDGDELLQEAFRRAEELGGGVSVQKRLDRGAVYELVIPFRLCTLADYQEQSVLQQSELEAIQEQALALALERKRAQRASVISQEGRLDHSPGRKPSVLSADSTPMRVGPSPYSDEEGRGGITPNRVGGKPKEGGAVIQQIPSYPDELIVPNHPSSLLGDGVVDSEGVELFKRGSHKWAEIMTSDLGASIPDPSTSQSQERKVSSPSAEELLRSAKSTPQPPPSRGGKRKKPTPAISKDTVSLSREQLSLVEGNLPPKAVKSSPKSSPLFQKTSLSVGEEAEVAKSISLDQKQAKSFNRSRVLIAIGPEAATTQPESLEEAGFDVTTARSGKELMVLMESRLFDVLILDVEFPEVQALETAKQIRSKERLSGGRVPIIALVKPTNATRYKKQHPEIDEFVAKPATESQIIEKVQQLCKT